jgi:hypothetical protein
MPWAAPCPDGRTCAAATGCSKTRATSGGCVVQTAFTIGVSSPTADAGAAGIVNLPATTEAVRATTDAAIDGEDAPMRPPPWGAGSRLARLDPRATDDAVDDRIERLLRGGRGAPGCEIVDDVRSIEKFACDGGLRGSADRRRELEDRGLPP